MASRVFILGLLLVSLAGCASTPRADEASLTVPAAVVYHVDEDRWELVTEQADEYPDEILFETVLADGSRVPGLLPPERVFQPPTIRWKSPQSIILRDGHWRLGYIDRHVSIQFLGLRRQPLETFSRRFESFSDPDAPPAYSVSIKNTTIPFE